jgi:hypothetical protein
MTHHAVRCAADCAVQSEATVTSAPNTSASALQLYSICTSSSSKLKRYCELGQSCEVILIRALPSRARVSIERTGLLESFVSAAIMTSESSVDKVVGRLRWDPTFHQSFRITRRQFESQVTVYCAHELAAGQQRGCREWIRTGCCSRGLERCKVCPRYVYMMYVYMYVCMYETPCTGINFHILTTQL